MIRGDYSSLDRVGDKFILFLLTLHFSMNLIQCLKEGRFRRNILKTLELLKIHNKSVKISRFSPKYSPIFSFLSQVCCLVTPTKSFVLKIFSKYFGGIGLLVTTGPKRPWVFLLSCCCWWHGLCARTGWVNKHWNKSKQGQERPGTTAQAKTSKQTSFASFLQFFQNVPDWLKWNYYSMALPKI